jgi:hypothetical protein
MVVEIDYGSCDKSRKVLVSRHSAQNMAAILVSAGSTGARCARVICNMDIDQCNIGWSLDHHSG